MRKNANIWKDWQPGGALGLHVTQVRILVRALQLLKVGGRVVYSTCSMNPVENEAVVAAAIDRCGGLDVGELAFLHDDKGPLAQVCPRRRRLVACSDDGYSSNRQAAACTRGLKNLQKYTLGVVPHAQQPVRAVS